MSNGKRASAQASFMLSSSDSCSIANRAHATRAFVAGPLYNESTRAILAATELSRSVQCCMHRHLRYSLIRTNRELIIQKRSAVTLIIRLDNCGRLGR
jgi:hypothetical protein